MSLRFLHTADWHLGQLFHGYDRDFEHSRFLDWLLGVISQKRPDALILSGDVFDTVNPSAQAQRRFYDFLARAHAATPALQIVITAGNHDAAARLEAPSGLLESLRITVVGTIPRDQAGVIMPERLIVPVRNSAGEVEALVLAVPFLRHADLPLVPVGGDAYLDGVAALYRSVMEEALKARAISNQGAALIALGHCHFAGGEESRDSERRIVIGGAESLRADAFSKDLAYVALGHLHKPQEFEGGRICYSGSPIPLSFAEQGYAHRVALITVDGGQRTSIEHLPVPRSVALLRIPAHGAGTLGEVLNIIGATQFEPLLSPEAQPFLEIQLLDDGPDPKRRHRIEEALQGKPVRLASIKLIPPVSTAVEDFPAAPTPTLADLSSLDPSELLADAHRERYQADPDPSLLTALHEILAAENAEPVVQSKP